MNLGSRTRQLDKADLQDTWQHYLKSKEKKFFDRLAEHYLPLVKYLADRLAERLPKSVQVDDLISAGIFGLLDALERFDPTRGVKFESYCTARVRGSMLDELRNEDWIPRLTRQKLNRLDHTIANLEKKLGRLPTDEEVAASMAISMKELTMLYRDYGLSTLFNLNIKSDDDATGTGMEIVEDKEAENPFTKVAKKDIIEMVQKNLATKERQVFMLYYAEELTMKEIGAILKLSESRVSQIHGRVMAKIRNTIRKRLVGRETTSK